MPVHRVHDAAPKAAPALSKPARCPSMTKVDLGAKHENIPHNRRFALQGAGESALHRSGARNGADRMGDRTCYRSWRRPVFAVTRISIDSPISSLLASTVAQDDKTTKAQARSDSTGARLRNAVCSMAIQSGLAVAVWPAQCPKRDAGRPRLEGRMNQGSPKRCCWPGSSIDTWTDSTGPYRCTIKVDLIVHIRVRSSCPSYPYQYGATRWIRLREPPRFGGKSA